MICVVANEQLGCCITWAVSRWWCRDEVISHTRDLPRVCSAGASGKMGLFLRCPGQCVECHGIHYTGGATSWTGAQRSTHGERAHRRRCIITAWRKGGTHSYRGWPYISAVSALCQLCVTLSGGEKCRECLIFNDSCRELYWMLGFMLIWNKLFQRHDYEKIRQYCGFRTLS